MLTLFFAAIIRFAIKARETWEKDALKIDVGSIAKTHF
jgi:hypothetical protein